MRTIQSIQNRIEILQARTNKENKNIIAKLERKKRQLEKAAADN